MHYTEFSPHKELDPYIDCYWQVIGENVYIVGTMTHCKQPCMHNGIRLVGIRFKPAAFAAFYSYASLRELTDRSIDFEKKLSPSPDLIIRHGISYLDKFYLDRFSKPRHLLFPVIKEIQQYHGTLPVAMIAKRHFISERQLERNFNQYLGVSPAEFSSFVRYRHTIPGGFQAADPSQKPLGIELAFTTTDVEKHYQQALAAGAFSVTPVETKPWGQIVGYVKDINGVLIEICTPVG